MLFQNRYGSGLLQYPGPFLASLTNFWRVRDAYVNGRKRPSYVRLHNQYGSVVRLGPESLSFSNPAAIDDIYNTKNNMAKSKWYIAFEAHGKGHKKENLFSTRDIHWHARYRAAVARGFTMSHLAEQEKQIDGLIMLLLQNLDEAASKTQGGGLVDLPLNLQYFTFDAGGVFAFDTPYGFLKSKLDLDGIIQSVRVGSVHLNRLAQAPLLQVFLDKNPLAVYFGFIAPPMAFAQKYLPTNRIEASISDPKTKVKHHDILDQYLTANSEHPDVVTKDEIVDLGLMVVVPASEAVRTAISVCIFQMIKHPAALSKLQREIDSVITDREAIPDFATVSTQLPYLDACIKETFRIHPSTGFMMDRIVPPGGAVIDGHFVPAGTTVGCSSWVIHRHKPTYGEDVETFRPERWLEASPDQRANMEKFLCPFGFESRLCLGREIGLFEVVKLCATLFSKYTITLENPKDDMAIEWGNIVSVDFNVMLARRKV
ncbi:putative cytochrome P450 [Rhexocercosporidium sp. MPI-PUGE-AT-0058]|nr:putative cytochrome P450 [Rhexocercosporidium sp. MPI-PUGE-AT-0058]